ncbi:MAG: hypothetical protein K6F74_05365 [Prevotella sp.]|nr:hypothetical protein [Prevotella sp.]
MDYKKKYSDLIERLRKAMDDDSVNDDRYCCVIKDIVPELEEPDDERIRKAIVDVFKTHCDYEVYFGVSVTDILAWLEKKGEQNLATSAKTCKDEQKPTDKVEPKFHKGEWITIKE